MALLVLLIALPFSRLPARAAVSSCTTSVDRSSVTADTSADYDFTITNTNGATAVWIRITRPSSNFTIQNISVSGWGTAVTSSNATLEFGTLTSGSSLAVTLGVLSGSSEAAAADWTVQISDAADGSGATTCTGSLSTAISGAGPDTTDPTISNIAVTDITDTTATLTWSTNEAATSFSEYGPTDEKAFSTESTSLVTNHILTLSGLSASTTYFYTVGSADAAGNTKISEENTFTTSAAASPTPTPTPTPSPSGEVSPSPSASAAAASPTPTAGPVVAAIPGDTTSPQVALTTNLAGAFLQAPVIAGEASDSSGVRLVQYSLDGGRNWLPVDVAGSPGAVSTPFSFLPFGLTDNNFDLVVRAFDGSGNEGRSRHYTLVIDRLPPRVGPVLFSQGPQRLIPASAGTILTLAGLPQTLTVSAIGGPTEMVLAISGNGLDPDQSVPLVQNQDSGLWSGSFTIPAAGAYNLELAATDGANNRTRQAINPVTVLPAGRILDGAQLVAAATVTLFVKEAATQQFVPWQAEPFGQPNPQTTSAVGDYRYYVPPGIYYLQVEAPGFQIFKSNIFIVEGSALLHSDLALEPGLSLSLGLFSLPLPSLRQTTGTVLPTVPPADSSHTLVGTQLPDMELTLDTGETLQTAALTGKPSVLSLLATWDPDASQQLTALDTLSRSPNLNVAAITQLETAAQTISFRSRGGYRVNTVVDPLGQLKAVLPLLSAPAHLILDTSGVIRQVVFGAKTATELQTLVLNSQS